MLVDNDDHWVVCRDRSRTNVELTLGKLAILVVVAVVADLFYAELSTHGPLVEPLIGLGVLVVVILALFNVIVETRLQVSAEDVHLERKAPFMDSRTRSVIPASSVGGWYVRSIKGASTLAILTLYDTEGRRVFKYTCQPWAGTAEEMREALTHFGYHQLSAGPTPQRWTRMTDGAEIRQQNRERRARRISGRDGDGSP